jgi:hypothetical protein
MGNFHDRKRLARQPLRYVTPELQTLMIERSLIFSILSVEGLKEYTVKPPRGKQKPYIVWELAIEFTDDDIAAYHDFEGYYDDAKLKPRGLQKTMLLQLVANSVNSSDVEAIEKDLEQDESAVIHGVFLDEAGNLQLAG